jgi:hypothetical protein
MAGNRRRRGLLESLETVCRPKQPLHDRRIRRPPISSGTVADSGERFKGAEKRRSPRYKCEGSAEICEDGRAVRTWATFSDISLHGCYVEAQATYPAGSLGCGEWPIITAGREILANNSHNRARFSSDISTKAMPMPEVGIAHAHVALGLEAHAVGF